MDRESAKPTTHKPGPHTKAWDKFHLRHASRSTYELRFVWDRSKPATGPFCTDVDNNIILDFVSHVGVNALGYNHPELVALQQRLAGIDPDRYAGADFIGGWGADPEKCPIPTPSHLHRKLMEWTKQFKFDCALLTNTGSEAVENAIKICYDHRRNNGYGITFDGAFHGRTLGALSLNRSKAVHRKWYPALPKVVSFPYGTDTKEFNSSFYTIAKNGKRMSLMRQQLDKSIGIIDPDEVAYIIMEPMQGEGGYNVPHKDFMAEVQEIASTNNIPLIMDEIQAGMGRTGKRWACEHFKMQPDIITASKALRVGATMGKADIFPKEDGRVSGTWVEGNADSSAIGYKIMEIIERDKLMDNATKMGEYLRKRLNELPKFSNVRGLGLMDAVDLPDKETRNKVVEKALNHGLLLIGAGNRSIRFLPPLNVTRREIDLAVDILEKAGKSA